MNHIETLTQERSQAKWLVFALCWLGGIFAGMNSTLFSVLLPHAIADVTQSTDRAVISQIGAYVMGSFLIGWMLGGMLLGVVSDKFGRVRAMAASIALYSISTGLAGMAQNTFQLALCRFLSGVGVGGEMLCISVYLAEVWPSNSRAIALGALVTSYQTGVFCSGLVSQTIPDWRMAFAVCSFPLILCLIVMWQLEEPIRWRNATANDANKNSAGYLQTLFSGSERRDVIVGALTFGALLVGFWASLSWIPTWIQDLLGSEAQGHEKNYATMFQGFFAVIGCFLSGPLANRFGRIPVITASFLGAFAISAVMFLTTHEFSTKVYVESAILGFCIGLAQAVMYIYLPELFPTRMRATAVGFCLNFGRLITSVAVLFLGLLVPLLGGYAHVLFAFSCIYLVGLSATFWGKETRQEALPE